MKLLEDGANLTVRTRYIRMCIAQALIRLMANEPLEKITITNLVKEANVSRMTFYKYFSSKLDVLTNYVYELMNLYMEDSESRTEIGRFRELKHIHHCIDFFKTYHVEMKTLIDSNMFGVIINVVNDYMDTYILPFCDYSSYELYCYAGGLCNTYMKWIETGMKETTYEIAEMIHKRLGRK